MTATDIRTERSLYVNDPESATCSSTVSGTSCERRSCVVFCDHTAALIRVEVDPHKKLLAVVHGRPFFRNFQQEIARVLMLYGLLHTHVTHISFDPVLKLELTFRTVDTGLKARHRAADLD